MGQHQAFPLTSLADQPAMRDSQAAAGSGSTQAAPCSSTHAAAPPHSTSPHPPTSSAVEITERTTQPEQRSDQTALPDGAGAAATPVTSTLSAHVRAEIGYLAFLLG